MARMALTADASLAAIRARSKFGIATAAMIRMIATTISNSISEKPFCFCMLFSLSAFMSHRTTMVVATNWRALAEAWQTQSLSYAKLVSNRLLVQREMNMS